MTVPFKTQFFSQPNISSAHIIDRTITTSDIALGTIDISNLSTACIASLSGNIPDGTITEAMLSPEFLTNLLDFTRRLTNLENPGWYGNFQITNSNSSNPNTITFQIYFDTLNIVTNTTDTITIGDPITLAHNEHYDLVLPIGSRLTNGDTIIRLAYSTSGGDVTIANEVGIGAGGEEDEILIVVSNSYIHDGNIELTVELTN